jgi:hypothetical protein
MSDHKAVSSNPSHLKGKISQGLEERELVILSALYSINTKLNFSFSKLNYFHSLVPLI